MNTKKKIITTDLAPKAVGPYSQAVQSGAFLFVSGQIPLDPETGQLVGTDIETQSLRALENLKTVIEAAGRELSDVVKCTCFLQDLEHFGEFNEVYARFFPSSPPARECVQVSRLPRDALVEISAICGGGPGESKA
jgi:2-iminobutanoate/2-iminopropanoate deaminase